MPAAAAIIFADAPNYVRVPASALSQVGFRAWVLSDEFPEQAHASWIGGELLIDMNAEAIDTHNAVKTEITAVLHTIVRDEGLGELYSDGVLFTNDEAAVSTEPDVTFVSFAAIEQGRVHFGTKANREDDRLELHGTPDLVVEILSDSSERKDLHLLRAAYARAGVHEYWIVDARGDALRFDVLVLQDGEYRGATASAVLGRPVTLERAKNRVGRWMYRLRAG